MRQRMHARLLRPACYADLLNRRSRPTHLWSQIPAQILVLTSPRCTTSEGPWFNPDLVGKLSPSPAKSLPFHTQAQPNPVKVIPFLPQTQTNTILLHHPTPEIFLQFSLFPFSGFLQHTVRKVVKQMPSLLCLLFYNAFSDHAFVFLCVSIHLQTELDAPQKTPTQRLSMGLKSETQLEYIAQTRLAVGELGTSTQSISSFGIFFPWIFFLGLVLADWSPPLP